MEKLIEKLQKNDYKTFNVLDTEQIEFVNAEDFERAQEGFRFDPVANHKIEEWDELIGKNFYVIGFDCTMGDPIIADAGTEGFPIYHMWHDDWDFIKKVADSFDEFIENLKSIEKTIKEKNQTSEGVRKFVENLDNKNSSRGFYEDICFEVLDEEGSYYDEFSAKPKDN